MTRLDNILVFVKVGEFESISKAARSLGMPISTVSRKLSALEAELGVSLVRRTTRRVTLTPQGRHYFNECAGPLTTLRDAERVLTQTQARPEGTLTISVPMILTHGIFLDFLSMFSREHPGIRIDLYITNAYLDLVADNIDIAVRFGELRDSSVVAKKLGKSVRYVVATPEYLKGRKLPSAPEDLEMHECVLLNGKSNAAEWELISGRKKIRVHVSGSVSSRDCNTLSAFVFRGHGIGLLEASYCDQPLARGDLIRLLPRWTSTVVPVSAVYPSRKFLPAKVSVFLDALARWKNPVWTRE
jgi:DNA-binding transcriptional LysR family regulator